MTVGTARPAGLDRSVRTDGRGRSTRAPLIAAAAAAAALAVFAYALIIRLGGDSGVARFDDLGQLAAAGAAAVAAGAAARRATGRLRTSWSAIALGAGGWTLGQVIWCYYELLAHRDTPFPSAADAGYLLFPIGAAIGLALFPSIGDLSTRRRWILDGSIISSALITVSWSTTLGAVARAGGDDALGFAVSVAYPVGDIVILSMAILALCRPRAHPGQLVLLSAAMAAMSVADSSFAYLTATGRYHTGNLSDIGWVGAFLLLAVAATAAGRRTDRAPVSTPPEGLRAGERPAPATMLPYVPVLVAAAMLSIRHLEGHSLGGVEFAGFSISMALVLLRQYSTVRENRALLGVVAVREAQLHRQAFYDQLTGLANRALFINRAEHALDLHRRDLRPVAVLFCDLDDFKTINDSMGHGAGDTVLVQVADRLRGALRPGDTLARLGGDEFAVLLEDGADPATVGSRLVQALDQPFTVTDIQLTVRVSVGLTELLPEEPTPSLDNLLAHADIAMYAAKRSGKGRLARYERSMAAPYADDVALRDPLIAAVAASLIEAAYQPIVRIDSGDIVGLEALARWNHDGIAVPPIDFIPLASRAGQLEALANLMLEQACAELAAWNRHLGHQHLQLAVNIPPGLVTDTSFPGRVVTILTRHELRPGQLVLEITEEALLSDLEAARQVTTRLHDLGVRLCLDGFGTGYSSLLHLQQISLDTLKIDRGFVAGIDTDLGARRLLEGILSLADGLGLDVVAEGVERAAQADILSLLGCRYAQGYLYAEPAAPELVPGLLGTSLQPELTLESIHRVG